MIQTILKKIVGTRNQRIIKKMRPLVARVGEFEPKMQALSDDELARQTLRFKEQIENGASLDDLLPEAFATVREAAVRTLGMRHYDVQIIGGIALHRGMIAEMKTGEGKTLVATLAAYLNALQGRGVHVVTVNDYLARRDAEWMGRVYRFLGLSVGVVLSNTPDYEHRQAYECDITYGQNNEFGFDYLRDNMKYAMEDRVQRELYYAIVDEVDSILIDEARTPLIISGAAEKPSELYYKVDALVRPLKRDEDYVVDEKAHSVTLTEVGVDKIQRRLGLSNLYAPEHGELLHHIQQALRAHTLYKRDQHYLVEDGKVIIVDEFTGRKMPGRRWSDGLHQAVEAKEGLSIREENQTLATITFQNFFRMYEKLAGMTGTAETEAEEFGEIYELDVLVIPTNKPCIRKDEDDLVYTTERAKVRAIIDDIVDCYERGQPVLVGTTSVEKSEFLSKLLKERGVPHHVLNAKYHEREAAIVAQAGRKHAVTIATNMAGRGTDILLGGNPEFLAREEVGLDASEEEYLEALERYRAQCEQEREEVLQAGGLRIIGTERHESRRIDNQLRGRAGRQGDPGSSQFYLSLEDDLLRIFQGERIQRMMERLNVPEDEPIVHRWVTKSIESAQRKVEARNFDIRKNLLEYDDVMNKQRLTIYGMRDRLLQGADMRELIEEAIDEVAHAFVEGWLSQSDEAAADEESVDPVALAASASKHFRETIEFPPDTPRDAEGLGEALATALKEAYRDRRQRLLRIFAENARSRVEQAYTQAVMEAAEKGEEPPPPLVVDDAKLLEVQAEELQRWERAQYLQVVDALWKDHLQVMQYLRDGVHLYAYAQRDPKLIYKEEGYRIFQELIYRIKERVVETLFHMEVQSEEDIERAIAARREYIRQQLERAREIHAEAQRSSSPEAQGAVASPPQEQRPRTPYVREKPKVGRNDPCPCGSGKKYKKCCLPKEEAGQWAAQ